MTHDLTTLADARPAATVKDVMTSVVVTVEEDTPIPAVALRMAQQSIHRVIVVDKRQPLRGLVTSMEVLWWIAAQG